MQQKNACGYADRSVSQHQEERRYISPESREILNERLSVLEKRLRSCRETESALPRVQVEDFRPYQDTADAVFGLYKLTTGTVRDMRQDEGVLVMDGQCISTREILTLFLLESEPH